MRYPPHYRSGTFRRQRKPGVLRDWGDRADHNYLRSLLPPGLAAALPTQPPAVLFVAVALAHTGRRAGDLARQFRLSPEDARTVVSYTLGAQTASPSSDRKALDEPAAEPTPQYVALPAPNSRPTVGRSTCRPPRSRFASSWLL